MLRREDEERLAVGAASGQPQARLIRQRAVGFFCSLRCFSHDDCPIAVHLPQRHNPRARACLQYVVIVADGILFGQQRDMQTVGEGGEDLEGGGEHLEEGR